MSEEIHIAVVVGSLRKEAFSRKVANAMVSLAPQSLRCNFIEIGDLPLYNEDLDKGDVPAAWTRFREDVKKCKAVLFVTPEYNRSIPGGLKNAVDVGSRPYGKSVWSGLPAAVVSTSPSKIGGFGANQALRQTFVFLDMPVMQQPEAYVGGVAELFEKDGKLKSDETKEFLQKFMNSFEAWIQRLQKQDKAEAADDSAKRGGIPGREAARSPERREGLQ